MEAEAKEHTLLRYFLRWTIALVYTLGIFGVTLGSIYKSPWSILVTLFGGLEGGGTERAGIVVNYAVPLIGLAAVIAALFTLCKKRFRSLLWLGAVAGGFLYLLLLHCVYPMEQVHLLQFSLLAWLFFRAFNLTFKQGISLGLAALFSYVAGAADEGIQSLDWVPRSGTMGDVYTNWAACSLGLIGLMACLDGGYWTWHKRRNLGIRFFLGYVLPIALIAVAAQQLWTRFIHPPINLLLITVDCCRPSNMSAYGHDQLTTPNLDRLMPDAARFDKMFSQACWTCPGVVSTLTGIYPPAHGVRHAGATLPEVVDTVLDLYRKRGYRVPNLAYLTEDPTFHNLGSLEPMDPVIAESNENVALTSWLDKNYQDPFAIWFHYRGIHLPYHPAENHLLFPPAVAGAEPPEEIKNLLQKEEIIPKDFATFSQENADWIKALYDAEMHEFDGWFEAWRYRLRLHHILDDTLIVITADHGEELLEHGDVGHGSTLIHSKHYDELLHIPLIMHCPRLIPEGIQIDTLAEQVDILPTIMDLMGWPIPPEVQGRSLAPALRGEPMDPKPVFAESIEGGYQSKEEMAGMWVRSMRTRDHKFIEYTGHGEPLYEYYNLSEGQDPGERDNLAPRNSLLMNSESRKLHEWLDASLALGESIAQRQADIDAARARHIDPSLLYKPEVLDPKDGAEIGYDTQDGKITIRWTGVPEAMYVRQIKAGKGFHSVYTNEDEVAGTMLELGPFPRDAWKPLYKWNPFRFRVRPKDLPDAWSDWVNVNIKPLPEAEE